MLHPRIGIFGGSGLYQMEGFEVKDRVRVSSPFGKASDEFVIGEIDGKLVAFLPRHGVGHVHSAHEVNYRANIWAMKKLGVEWIFSVSAVGSLKEEYHPGHMVVVDQFIDRTRNRASTFFENGVAGHILFADPICGPLADVLYRAAQRAGGTVHKGGTYVCMEGPALSTRAESHLYRSWNADVIGMTNATEARLAREAEICYATLAMITDYDCWKQNEEAFSAEKIVQTFAQNVKVAQATLREAVRGLELCERSCPCCKALDGAILTSPDRISPYVLKRLEVVAGRVLNQN